MSGDGLWTFADRLYAKAGVAEACLWLQHRHDLDVMLLLSCLWAGYERGPLHPAQLRMLIAGGDPWRQEVIKPLRAARQWLKGAHTPAGDAAAREALRRAILDDELAAERLQGELFTALLRDWTGDTLPASPGAAAGEHNVRLYLKLLSIPLDSEDEQRLRIILGTSPAPA